jgi:hypothetical protein
MTEKYTLIASRSEEDRTKMIIAYANINPTATLILSQSYTKEWIYANTSISKDVNVVENLDNIDLSQFETIFIDYIEVFDQEYISKIINDLKQIDIEIVVAIHMKPNNYAINNIFEQK